MKEGWEYRQFESCLVKVPKQVQVKSKDYKKKGKFPIVSQEAELISGYWDDETIVYKPKEPVVIFGDHTKIIKYVDFDFVVGADGTHILRTKNDIYSKFFYYVLKSIKLRQLGYARHYKLLKEKFIPVPPLSEQQSIVDYLDSAFAKIDAMKANAEKALNEAKALFQASLKEMLEPKEGWEEMKFGKICEFVRGPFGGSLKKECFRDSGYAVYEQQNAIYNKFTFRYFIDDEKYKSLIRFKVNPGDLIMSCSGTIGKVAIIPEDCEEGVINQALLKLTPKNKIDAHFLKYLMESNYFGEIINANIEGVAIKNIASVAVLKEIILSIPTVSVQQSIVETLDSLKSKVGKLQENYDKISQECDALKQALLREVFEG